MLPPTEPPAKKPSQKEEKPHRVVEKAKKNVAPPLNVPEGQKKSPVTPRIRSGEKGAIKKVSLKISSTKDTKNQEQELPTSKANLPASSFSAEKLASVWGSMAARYKKSSLSLHMALTQNEPKLKDAHTVIVYVENSIQEELVRENTTEILTYLHRELDNALVRLETAIRKQRKKQKAYLPKEKFEELIKKNPHIKKLRDELGLDLDY